jgi:predicted aspartyl protease
MFALLLLLVTLPLDVWNHHPYVHVAVNHGPPQWFLIDTGAGVPITILDSSVARAADLQPAGSKRAGAIGGAVRLELLKPAKLVMGRLTIRGAPVAQLPLTAQSKAEGHAIGGIIGYDLLRRFNVRIDYRRKTVTFSTPRSQPTQSDTMRISNKVPIIPVRVGAQFGERLLQAVLDTGEDLTAVVSRPLADQLALRYAQSTHSGQGLGGTTKSANTSITRLRVGCVTHTVVHAQVNLDAAGNLRAVGFLIGGGLLSDSVLTLDYAHHWFMLSNH